MCFRPLFGSLKKMQQLILMTHSTNPYFRIKGIVGMQNLQMPGNPDDPVIQCYLSLLSSDKSSKVRIQIITSMARNPVKFYQVAHRLTLLEKGLNDRSEAVRNTVKTVLLQQWLKYYQQDYIAFIKGFELDPKNKAEMERFRKVVKKTLKVIFDFPKDNMCLAKNYEDDEFRKITKQTFKGIFGLPKDMLGFIEYLPLNDKDDEFHHCVPFEQLSIEAALYWEALSKYLKRHNKDKYDLVLPEISVFCKYAEKFCEMQNGEMDKFERMEFQYILRSLMGIINNYDIGEENGRIHLQNLVGKFLKDHIMDEKIIEVAIRYLEKLMPDLNARMEFLAEIIKYITDERKSKLWHNRIALNKLLADCSNTDLRVKIASLQIKLVELEEQERIAVEGKDYFKLQQISEKKNTSADEFMNLLKALNPLLDRRDEMNKLLRGFHIMYFMIHSKHVSNITLHVLDLYNSMVMQHMASGQKDIKDLALKCCVRCWELRTSLENQFKSNLNSGYNTIDDEFDFE